MKSRKLKVKITFKEKWLHLLIALLKKEFKLISYTKNELVFNATIKNVDEWKAVVNAIGDIVEDAMFICNDDGVTFRGMDPAHITLLDITFPKSSFDNFESQTSFFGLNVNELKMILNTTNLGDEIHLQIDNPSSLRVSITGSLDMVYNIRLVERTEVNVPIPKITCTSKISVNSETLGRIMSNLSKISDYVSIDCFTNNVEFSGKGDSGDAKINIDNANPDLYEIDALETTSSSYSLEYMAKIIRDIGRASKKVNIQYASKHPMHMQFEMPSAKVEYYLAPRVEV